MAEGEDIGLDDLGTGAEVAQVVRRIARVARDLSKRIARGPLEGHGATRGENSDGDTQKALDLIADEAFAAALTDSPVRWYASEEREEVAALNSAGALALAIDPLDGSSNIDTNVSIGTIFSILPAEEDPLTSVLRPGTDQLAAGYVIYGPQTALVLTLGKGTSVHVLDPETGRFEQVAAQLEIPAASSEFAINVSNYRHWGAPVRAYIDDCLAGDTGPRAKNFNMRWIASLVAETHRIVSRGGIFLYPADARRGYERGRLRHVYECAPIALLIEQAGGAATDGCDRILDRVPQSLHERTPFVFGTADKVHRVAAYHDLPHEEVAALFGRRGLFRQ
ncbi:class 1 fructose-bisphosphatase [Paracoccus chinensis]|uniref:Fructose-1,6-bisphosphatase class 1 n=1 Tax=Paracoccus chinensis TaxID=525640 RepID=A0A1G9N5Y3_9RHOB|nr:class 1 fructose-bisphosphatase [Paracoccus chinensis]SDL81793.1 D-fructose 1,6-bisphosphatase [Paracoccus chinensis]